MEKVKGVITAVSQKEGKYGIAMGTGNWYNGFGKAPCNKGDEVEITYEQNGTFKNIDQVYVSKKSETSQTNPSESNKYNMEMSKLKNHTNARCSALDNATKICIARNETSDEKVIITASEFLKFIEE